MPPVPLRRCIAARLLAAALVGGGLPAFAGAPDRGAAEIAALLAHLGESTCAFERNGQWYSGSEGSAHLKRKWRQASLGGGDATAEQFIDSVASRSSETGQPYTVRCDQGGDSPAGQWLMRLLQQMRKAGQ